MKILIAYFSGAGNTRLLSKFVEKKLKEKFEVKVRSIENLNSFDLNPFDLIIFAFPVYIFNAPEPVWNFLESLPYQNFKKPFFIISTMALSDVGAVRRVSKYLKNLGWKNLGNYKVKMIGTDGILFIKKNSKLAEKLKKSFWNWKKHANFIVEDMMKKIQNSDLKVEKLDSNQANYKVSRKFTKKAISFFSKRMYVNENCNLCGACVQICPTNNITIENNKVIFHENCAVCVRCVHHCPEEAIQITRFTEGKMRWRDLLRKSVT